MSTAIAMVDTTRPGIPLVRLVKVELRKMFDTRSGFWLLASIGIIAVLATIGVILFLPDDDFGYGVFGTAIGVPFTILLPIVAILSVTGEWSQRTGLITFTLLPHRDQVIWAKAIAAVIVAVTSMVFSFAVGALGNIVGSAIAGVDTRWDVPFTDMLCITLANVLGLLVGFMLGVLIRNSSGAIVGYFVYAFIIPIIFGFLTGTQDWFAKIQPWIDFSDAQTPLYDGGPSGEQWAQIGTSGLIWFIIPMIFGVWAVLRSEVK